MSSSKVTKLNNAIATWGGAGQRFAEKGLELMLAAIEVACENGNIDPMKRIADALESASDKKAATTIFSHFFPITVKDDVITAVKGWQKRVSSMPSSAGVAEHYKSFRKLAADLTPETESSAPALMDTAAYVKALAKLNKKAADSGLVDAALLRNMGQLVNMIEEQLRVSSEAAAPAEASSPKNTSGRRSSSSSSSTTEALAA